MQTTLSLSGMARAFPLLRFADSGIFPQSFWEQTEFMRYEGKVLCGKRTPQE